MLDQPGPQRVVGSQCVRLPILRVEGAHERRHRQLPIGVRPDVGLDERDGLPVPAQFYERLCE